MRNPLRLLGCVGVIGQWLAGLLFLGAGVFAWRQRPSVPNGDLRLVLTLFAILLVLSGFITLLARRARRLVRIAGIAWLLAFVALLVAGAVAARRQERAQRGAPPRVSHGWPLEPSHWAIDRSEMARGAAS